MRKAVFFMILVMLYPCQSFAQRILVVQRAKKEITLTGYTRSKTTVTVSSEVSGKVLRVNYDMGQVIGEKPFYEIDPTFIDFQIKSTLQSVKKLDISKKRAKSRVAYLKKEFIRIDTLHKGDRATGVKRDAAAEELQQAKFDRDSIAMDKAVLETTLKELKERKSRHSVYAPQGWIVVEKIAEQGEIVGSGTPLVRIADYRNLVVPLAVSGEELEAIKKLPEKFEARLEERTVKASVHWVNPEFNEKTRKLGTELILADYDREKRGGLSFSLPLQIYTEGLLVPKAAVTNRYDNPRVTTGETGETVNVMILGESGDNIVIAEHEKLFVGMELKSK
ncbi:MAG: HlyD family efflux transporter periplasmic adaptor subunit [Desulfobacterales bacterium]|nr:HlyD family efflux transporter periplasmic adaptor subunit [Desulfobacterales bacterium]